MKLKSKNVLIPKSIKIASLNFFSQLLFYTYTVILLLYLVENKHSVLLVTSVISCVFLSQILSQILQEYLNKAQPFNVLKFNLLTQGVIVFFTLVLILYADFDILFLFLFLFLILSSLNHLIQTKLLIIDLKGEGIKFLKARSSKTHRLLNFITEFAKLGSSLLLLLFFYIWGYLLLGLILAVTFNLFFLGKEQELKQLDSRKNKIKLFTKGLNGGKTFRGLSIKDFLKKNNNKILLYFFIVNMLIASFYTLLILKVVLDYNPLWFGLAIFLLSFSKIILNTLVINLKKVYLLVGSSFIMLVIYFFNEAHLSLYFISVIIITSVGSNLILKYTEVFKGNQDYKKYLYIYSSINSLSLIIGSIITGFLVSQLNLIEFPLVYFLIALLSLLFLGLIYKKGRF